MYLTSQKLWKYSIKVDKLLSVGLTQHKNVMITLVKGVAACLLWSLIFCEPGPFRNKSVLEPRQLMEKQPKHLKSYQLSHWVCGF